VLEQHTIQDIAHVAQSYGPVGFGIVVAIVVIGRDFFFNKYIKNKAFNPIDNLSKEISAIKVQLQKRVEYDDLKDYQRVDVADVEFKAIKGELSDIKRMLSDLLQRK